MITFRKEYNAFFLSGKDFTYAMRVNSDGYLTHTYYGKKIPVCDLSYYKPEWVGSFNPGIPGGKHHFADVMQEYGTAYLGDFREPALIPVDRRGSRVADLKYKSYKIVAEKPAIQSGIPTARGGKTLIITLRDFDTGLEVLLYYTVYEAENILTRRAEIVNHTGAAVTLERALSYTLDFFDSNYEVLTFWGHHATEKTPERTPLHHGRTSVGNTRGTTSANHANFMALLTPGTGEEHGEVYASSLLYSGSHYESAEVDESNRTRLCAGIQPETFAWKLGRGEHFETPEAALCYSDEGLGKMSRQYHDFFREYVMNPRWAKARRPVVLNSWEGMHFTFDRDRLFDTIDALKGTGIELFVLDDGWFGTRNNDRSGLGDWFVNEEKLPGGLMPIAERCHRNGLNFGLWIEPEMVNPDSDLYRAHPDWAIAVPGRAPVTSRHQCVLDFSRDDVVDYVKNLMADVIRNSGASYIKWDMNRALTENMSCALPADRQGELQHRYVLGVYSLAKYLTETFPDILFEGCSGGGGRFDGAMLAYFPQIWSSDNTDADDRTVIQLGTTMVFPLSASSNHVSISPNIRNGRATPARTRADVACLGTYGYEFDIKKIPPEELAGIAADVKKYREIDDLILTGDLYRGTNRTESNESLVCVVSKDKTRAFCVYYKALAELKMKPRFVIPGLDPKKNYRIAELDITVNGAVLANIGVVVPRQKADFTTFALTLTAE